MDLLDNARTLLPNHKLKYTDIPQNQPRLVYFLVYIALHLTTDYTVEFIIYFQYSQLNCV